MTRLKIGGVPEHFNLPWRLAIEEGDFKSSDIELHWSDMTGGTGQMIKGLQNGSIDVAVLLTEGITRAILQGLDAKILMPYVVTPLHWGIHVPYESTITEFNQLKNKIFAISREGSGSHLMTYIKAHQKGWKNDDFSFNVVGDIYGGLWALQNNAAQGFLWEKYTTQPYTEQKKCRLIDEVITPWPCFVIAARNEILQKQKSVLQDVCTIVHKRAEEVKKNKTAPENIAWRYNLNVLDAENWLNETDWNYHNNLDIYSFENVVSTLTELELISKIQSINWQQKLFL